MTHTHEATLSGQALAVRAERIDAPVPGAMAPCFKDDQRLVAMLLTAAAGRGACHFVSDFEQPSPQHDSEAYWRWGELVKEGSAAGSAPRPTQA